MDCQTALHILMEDPFADYSDEEWEAAGEHMESCRRCHETFHHGSVLDQRLAQIMVQVAPPVGLKKKLHENLSSVSLTPAATVPAAVPESAGRRNWLQPVSLIAAILLLGALLFYFRPQPASPELFTARQLSEIVLDQNWQNFPEFDNSFSLNQSTTLFRWKTIPQLGLESAPRGYRSGEFEHHILAIHHFQLPTRTASANGLLLVVPVKYLTQPPTETQLNGRNPEYLESSHGHFISVSWVEQDLAYICILELVPDGGDKLEQLQHIIYGQRA